MKRQFGFLGHVRKQKRGVEYQVVTGTVKRKEIEEDKGQTFLGWIGKRLDKEAWTYIWQKIRI